VEIDLIYAFPLDAFDNMRSLSIELCRVPIVGFFLAVFQTITLMVLQQPMLPTIMPLAKPTVTNDSLRTLLTILIRAFHLLGWHTATDSAGEVQCCFAGDVVVGEGAAGEMLACVDEADVLFWKRGSDG